MDDPRTELDPRFSDTDAQPTPWETTREVLESAQIAWLSTVRADGRPHVTPLVPVWLDGAYYFSTGPTEQKALNLAANPNVVLTTGCNQWERGLDVVVEGPARRVTGRASLEPLAAAWATTWDGSWQYDVSDDGFHHRAEAESASSPEPGSLALVFAVEPTKVLAFGKGAGGFSHTRYLPR